VLIIDLERLGPAFRVSIDDVKDGLCLLEYEAVLSPQEVSKVLKLPLAKIVGVTSPFLVLPPHLLLGSFISCN